MLYRRALCLMCMLCPGVSTYPVIMCLYWAGLRFIQWLRVFSRLLCFRPCGKKDRRPRKACYYCLLSSFDIVRGLDGEPWASFRLSWTTRRSCFRVWGPWFWIFWQKERNEVDCKREWLSVLQFDRSWHGEEQGVFLGEKGCCMSVS